MLPEARSAKVKASSTTSTVNSTSTRRQKKRGWCRFRCLFCYFPIISNSAAGAISGAQYHAQRSNSLISTFKVQIKVQISSEFKLNATLSEVHKKIHRRLLCFAFTRISGQENDKKKCGVTRTESRYKKSHKHRYFHSETKKAVHLILTSCVCTTSWWPTNRDSVG